MRHARNTALLAAVLALSGCATEARRYQRNVAGARLCGDARALQQVDVDAIARAVARVSRKTIYAITSAGDPKLHLVDAQVCYPGALEDPMHRHNHSDLTL
jgi:hypothetical protein